MSVAADPSWLVRAFDDPSASIDETLGVQGRRLADMAALGVPGPAGLTVVPAGLSSTPCPPPEIMREIDRQIAQLTARSRRRAGAEDWPVLLSIWPEGDGTARAPIRLDGLGLSREGLAPLAERLGCRHSALEIYRRLLVGYAALVASSDPWSTERVLAAVYQDADRRGVEADLSAKGLDDLSAWLAWAYREHVGQEFPEDPARQLHESLRGLMASRGRVPIHLTKTIFASAGGQSGAGVSCHRHPVTGGRHPRVVFVPNAEPDDVVRSRPSAGLPSGLSEIGSALVDIGMILESQFGDLLRISFVVENSHLHVIDARPAIRTMAGSVRVAAALVRDDSIDAGRAMALLDADRLDEVRQSVLASPDAAWLTTGLGAAPGAASGLVALDAERASAWAAENPVVLVRDATGPAEVAAMRVASGVLTRTGGLTSHASVVARAIATPCVTGCSDMLIDESARTVRVGSVVVREGEPITIDGSTGRVYGGALPLAPPEAQAELAEILSWADERRTLGVRANAETPEDIARALDLGADGVGLCRTEHMLFEPERLALLRSLLTAERP